MTKESNVNYFPPPLFKPVSWKKTGKLIQRIGYAVTLFQLLLGVVSMLLFLLEKVNRGMTVGIGVNLSLYCAWCGLILLAIGVYFSWRYAQTAQKITKIDFLLSKQASIVKKLKIAAMVNSAGALVSFIGVEIILGVMFSIVLIPESGSLFNVEYQSPDSFIKLIHVSVISATAKLLAAHCIGLACSLWALNKIKQISH
ncbi:MAG: DUF3611 family protein [Cyanobacteria bacterium J06600_6]